MNYKAIEKLEARLTKRLQDLRNEGIIRGSHQLDELLRRVAKKLDVDPSWPPSHGVQTELSDAQRGAWESESKRSEREITQHLSSPKKKSLQEKEQLVKELGRLRAHLIAALDFDEPRQIGQFH